MHSEVETVDALTAVIHIQTDIINELFQELSQYKQAEELDQMPVVQKINLAASMRGKIREVEPV